MEESPNIEIIPFDEFANQVRDISYKIKFLRSTNDQYAKLIDLIFSQIHARDKRIQELESKGVNNE